MLLLQAPALEASEASNDPAANIKRLEQFVLWPHHDGIPVARAIEVSKFHGAVARLVEMLRSEDDLGSKHAVVITLGLTGDPGAVEPIISYLEEPDAGSPDGVLSDASYLAKSSALLGLAGFANRTTSPAAKKRALDYLKKGQEPFCWNKVIKWTSPLHKTPFDRNVHLTKLSILGLGLSGTEEALSKQDYGLLWLREHLKDPGAAADEAEQFGCAPRKWPEGEPSAALFTSLGRLLDDAIDTNEAVRRAGGLAEYYAASQ